MTGGLAKTFEALSATNNEAATSLLLSSLDSSDPDLHLGALKALLQRRSAAGHWEVLRRWEGLGQQAKATVAVYSSRFSATVRKAILGSDEQLAVNSCDAVLYLREFDLMPALVSMAEDPSHPNSDLAARTILSLAEALYKELAGPRDYENRRDPQLVRQFVVGALENSMRRFERHKRHEIAECFLLLARRDNAILKRILQNPRHRAYQAVVDLLLYSRQPGIQRLLLNYLEDPHAPSTIHRVLSRRGDLGFVRRLLQRVQGELSRHVQSNLKRIDSLHWLRDDLSLLEGLNDQEQTGAVRLVMTTGCNRLAAFEVVRFILDHGGPVARRAAAEALPEFGGVEANNLILRCLDDRDPQVQAIAVRVLRDHGIPGAMQQLIACIDSPHEVVRTAARECLPEFRFERILASFDMLDQHVAASTGRLVKHVDPEAISKLERELASPSRTRRLRAVALAMAMDAVAEVEERIIQLLADADHFLRAEAARALLHSDSPRSRKALQQSLLDRSPSVQEAAERTLQAYAEAARPTTLEHGTGGYPVEWSLGSEETTP